MVTNTWTVPDGAAFMSRAVVVKVVPLLGKIPVIMGATRLVTVSFPRNDGSVDRRGLCGRVMGREGNLTGLYSEPALVVPHHPAPSSTIL